MSVTDDAPTPAKFGDELTSLQRDIICVLSGRGEIEREGASGREVKQELENYYDAQVKRGRLYPSLNALADRGFVEKAAINGRENRYSLTDAGRRARDTHWGWQSSWADVESGFDTTTEHENGNGNGGDE